MGWLKLHRSLLDWEWYDNKNVRILFLHCLLKANYQTKKWHGVEIQPGQFVTSRAKLSIETGLSEQEIKTAIKCLKSTSDLTSESTNAFTVVTVCNWDAYQGGGDDEQPTNQPTHQPATNQRPTTTKEIKKERTIISVGSGYTEEFEAWWSLYPKKIGKGTAFTAFKRAKKKTTVAEMMKATEVQKKTWAREGKDMQYVPNPATWLNGCRWDDELDASGTLAQPKLFIVNGEN